MLKKLSIGCVLALSLIALLAGPAASEAQAAPELPHLYTWNRFELTLHYPTGWMVIPKTDAISVHPVDRDVSDGQGPELILFEVTGGTVDVLIQDFASGITGTVGQISAETVAGYPAQAFTFDQGTPDTRGALRLIDLGMPGIAGVAYTVRNSEADIYLPSLEAMYNSLEAIQVYENVHYGYTLQFPSGWVVVEDDTRPGEVALHPADFTGDSSSGPELVVLVLDDLLSSNLDEVMDTIIADRPGEFSAPENRTIAGFSARSIAYTNASIAPVVRGEILLVQIDAQTVLALGYRAPETAFDGYAPTFENIANSLAFAAPPVVANITSTSSASIQLPQRFQWEDAGLLLQFPDDWFIEIDDEDGDRIIIAQPEDYNAPLQLIQASLLPWWPGLELEDVAELAAEIYGEPVGEMANITVAGYPGLIYDILDTSEPPPLYLRLVTLLLEEERQAALLIFGAEEQNWEIYQPLISAFFSSVERLDEPVLRTPSTPEPASSPVLASLVSPQRSSPRQNGESFFWEDFGITFMLPSGWGTMANSTEFDLAIVSPEAMAGDSVGAYAMFSYFPTFGQGTTMEEALSSVAESVESEVVPFTTNTGVSGYAVHFSDEEAGTTHHLILLPYGSGGMFIQTTAADEDQDALVVESVNSMEIDPPEPDEDAVNAAFQESVLENGRLIYGDPDAPVKLVEYLSYTCSHCASYSHAMDRLIALEVETGRAQIEFVFIAGDQYADLVSRATLCAAEQGQGYTVKKLLYQGYFDIGYAEAYTTQGVNNALSDLGMDMERLNQCMLGEKYDATLEEARVRFTDQGLTGTPTVTLGFNGEDPAPIVLSDGTVWSGTIPISILRNLFVAVLEQGLTVEEFFG